MPGHVVRRELHLEDGKGRWLLVSPIALPRVPAFSLPETLTLRSLIKNHCAQKSKRIRPQP